MAGRSGRRIVSFERAANCRRTGYSLHESECCRISTDCAPTGEPDWTTRKSGRIVFALEELPSASEHPTFGKQRKVKEVMQKNEEKLRGFARTGIPAG
jgi:hypothetical protein